MDMDVDAYLFPHLDIQNDWNDVLRSRNTTGDVWISCRVHGKPGIYGSLKSVPNNPLTTSTGFEVDFKHKNCITVSHFDPNCQCTFLAPVATLNSIHHKSILSLDVTRGGLGVSSCVQGKLHIWDQGRGLLLRVLDGHVGDVTTCRFFPFGLVVLSAGADTRLMIWSAETGHCAATLCGHTRAVTDTAIVGRGQHIISTSRDGSAKLWDCATSSCLASLVDVGCNINSCAVNELVGNDNVAGDQSDDGKLVLLACEDRTLRGVVDVQGKNETFRYSCSSAVNTCCFVSPFEAVCGCQDGSLYLFDLRNTRESVHKWLYSAAVWKIKECKNGFWTCTGDGRCIRYSLSGKERLQLTGPDCDPVYDIAFNEMQVFTCCRDAIIRKYTLVE